MLGSGTLLHVIDLLLILYQPFIDLYFVQVDKRPAAAAAARLAHWTAVSWGLCSGAALEHFLTTYAQLTDLSVDT